MELGIILPTYNEAGNIQKLIKEIHKVYKQAGLIVVDGNSSDSTKSEVLHMIEQKFSVYFILQSKKKGLGKAYVDGFNFAIKKGFKYILTMDADLSHNPCYIPQLVEAIKEGYDFSIGSRYVPGGGLPEDWGVHRKALSFTANWLIRTLLYKEIKDSTSGYRCFTREALIKAEYWKVKSSGYLFGAELIVRLLKSGARCKEVPIIFINRNTGKSKVNFKEIIKALITLIRLKYEISFC